MTISPKNWPLKAGAFSLLAAAALAGVDQALKIWATAALQPVGLAQLLPGFIELRYVLNDGMAFSMLSGQRWLLLGGTGLILAALAVLLVVRRMPLPERLVWTLVLGGGLGNFIDRARTGVVVDYLNFQFISFPVFNFADICVCVGVGLLILLLVADMVRDSRGNRKADGPQAS